MASPLSDILTAHQITFDPGVTPGAVHFSLTSLESLHQTEEQHFWSRTKHVLVSALLRRYVRKQQFSLLDIGCGNGSLIRSMEDRFPEAIADGTDAYPEALLHCRQRTKKARLILQDLTAQPWTSFSTTYDVITLLDVLEHLDHPEKILAQAKELLNEGGIIIASVPAHRWLWSDRDVHLGHRKRYEPRELAALLGGAGYEVLHLNSLFFYLALPAFLYRKLFASLSGRSGEKIEKDELRVIPGVNALLAWIGLAEVCWSLFLPLPFGTSAYCVARVRATGSPDPVPH